MPHTNAPDISEEPPVSGTIDCLPVIPPPYSAISQERLTHHPHRHRSESVDPILDYEDSHLGQRSKVCCDAVLCKICLAGCLKFRRVLYLMSLVGLFSVIGAVTLGAARTSHNNFLTLSIMFGGKLCLTCIHSYFH